LERLADERKKLGELLAEGLINQEQFNRALVKAGDPLLKRKIGQFKQVVRGRFLAGAGAKSKELQQAEKQTSKLETIAKLLATGLRQGWRDMGLGEALLEGSGLTETYGFISEAVAVRTVEVTGRDLGEVLINALAHPDIPPAGDALSVWVPHVRVEKRTPRVVGRRSRHEPFFYVEVTIEYNQQRPLDSGGADPNNDAQHSLRGGASLTGIETSRDRSGDKIQVEHNGEIQTGTVSVMEVQGHLTRELIIATNDPEQIVREWVNHTNVSKWKGDRPREWLCTRVDYQLVDVVRFTRRYTFVFDFERRPTKWAYTVAFTNADGTVPGDVVEGKGIKDVIWHPERDFNTFFKN
jgi:hypothetical protein